MRQKKPSNDFAYPSFKVKRTERLEPDERQAGDIFSRLGYEFADAVADLVDNSVDANARNVLVRFFRTSAGVHSVLIADDGDGMNGPELREAMRFGSRSVKKETNLGKYGIGLKSASLSQAEVVAVLSKQSGVTTGRRWTLGNIKNKWTCEILDDVSVNLAFKTKLANVKTARSGTIVIWERLEHLRTLPVNIDQILKRTIDELCVELGIRFHRFIESERLRVAVDQQFAGEDPPEVQRYVSPLNPFSYTASGDPAYPVTLPLTIDDVKVKAECHIWPPKSPSPGYRLGGGKVALRQGFYFYRNDRVIQAGGWNRMRGDDGEPHLSLARVKIDLPSSLDSLFKLDVTKSKLDPAPAFTQAMLGAASRGVTFQHYIDDAYRVYRKQKKKDGAKFPFVPGPGMPSRARKAIERLFAERGAGRPKPVQFKWMQLDHDELVRADAESSTIALNLKFKKELREGGRADAPVLKLALMLLLQDELNKVVQTQKSNERLQKINLALIAALKEG